MAAWWTGLDRILRGEATRMSALRTGRVEVDPWSLSAILGLLAASYGVCMGTYAMFRGSGPGGLQVLASALKVPALFALTLAVTLPSLYVFNALAGSRLTLGAVVRLLIAMTAVMVTILASLGPIVAFFSASTTSYPFMVLLNVVVFCVSGLLGLVFLLQTLHRLSLVLAEPPSDPGRSVEPVGEEKGRPAAPGALEASEDQVLSRHVKAVFRCWVLLFAVVGAQMGWVLRPFLGRPGLPFSWFRARESNVFEAIARALTSLFS